jgi:hypothetical protein
MELIVSFNTNDSSQSATGEYDNRETYGRIWQCSPTYYMSSLLMGANLLIKGANKIDIKQLILSNELWRKKKACTFIEGC